MRSAHGWIDDGYTGKGHRRLVWPATGETTQMERERGQRQRERAATRVANGLPEG